MGGNGGMGGICIARPVTKKPALRRGRGFFVISYVVFVSLFLRLKCKPTDHELCGMAILPV